MKIGTQFLAAPLLIAAIALVSGLGYVAMIQAQTTQSQAAQAADTAQSDALKLMREQVSESRAEVFRTLALMASLEEAQVKGFRADLAAQIGQVQTGLDRLKSEFAADQSLQPILATASAELAQFLKRSDKAIDLSGMDPNIGVGAMKAAEDSFKAHAAAVAGVYQHIGQLQGARFAASEHSRQVATLTLGLVLLGAILASLGLAWRLKAGVGRNIAHAVQVTQAVAQGQLDQNISSSASDELGDLMRSLAQMVEGLRQSLGTVRQASDQIGCAAAEITSGNRDLSQRTEQAAASLQQTASSMEELTGTVKQTADSAATANQLATAARSVAERGGQVVAEVVQTMQDINSSSRRISDIIGTIDGIAFQTNILALNAAVEAARAGEQGRGFAVVASEVRNLAQRSAEAAREIKALIGASVDKVETGTRLVGGAGQTMGEIVASVQRVSDIIGEISAATSEQSSGISQINAAVSSLDGVTQQNAALVEQSSAAADSLHQQSTRLAAVVGHFQLGSSEVMPEGSAARASDSSRRGPKASLAVMQASSVLQRVGARAKLPSSQAAKSSQAADAAWESF
jgi:methyl-accepting chemotaxis protein